MTNKGDDRMKILVSAIAASMLLASGASAALVISAVEVNGGVTIAGVGTLDTSGMAYGGYLRPEGTSSWVSSNMNDNRFVFSNFKGKGAYLYRFRPTEIHRSFMAEGMSKIADYTAGNGIGLSLTLEECISCYGDNYHLLFLPEDFVSGQPIAFSMSFQDMSLDRLGLTRGRYVIEAPADTITINIGPPPPDVEIIDDDNGPPPFGGVPPIVLNPPAVPEPASWVSMILGFGVVGAASRRAGRHRRTQHAAA